MKLIFRISKWFHKWLGLGLILYGMLMGVSGIFVNHHDWIEGWSVPRPLVPPQYRPADFNRGTLAQAVFARNDPEQLYIAGSTGVWKSADGGTSFEPMGDGFPASPARRATNALLLLEDTPKRLLAGTVNGLFVCDPDVGRWSVIPLADNHPQVRSIMRIGELVLVFTNSGIWSAPTEGQTLHFERVSATRLIDPAEKPAGVSLIFLFFDLHSGAILGLPGRLVVDLVGLLIVFLCCSAFYLWYYPKYRRRNRARKQRKPHRQRTGRSRHKRFGQAFFRSLFNYHLKIGIWIAPVLLVLSGTGLFMRPPLLMIPAMVEVPAALYPSLPPAESWEGRINRAVHDHAHNRVLIEASDGFWATPDDDLERPFEPAKAPAPIHVMGTTVLETDPSGDLVVGSFSGGFRINRQTAEVTDIFTGKPPEGVSTMRSADLMVTGLLTAPDGQLFVSTFHQGLLRTDDALPATRFHMPDELIEHYRMPLWDYMFELHNGRFFRDWIGNWYQLVPILGSLLFLLLTITGVYDWIMIRLVLPRSKRSP